MKKEFSIDAAYKTSWGIFKKNPFYIIGFFVAIFFLSIVVFILIGSLSVALKQASWLTQILSWIVGSLLTITINTFLLNLFRPKKSSITAKMQEWKLVVKVLVASFLSGIIVIAGILLLIIPGIYFAMRLKFVSFYVVDKGMGPIEAVSASWNATKGNVFMLFVLSLLSMLINLVGLILFVVGLAVTAPLTQMVNTKVYLTISGEK